MISNTEAIRGEIVRPGHIFIRDPETNSWSLRADHDGVNALIDRNNNILFAGAVRVMLHRMQGAETLTAPFYTQDECVSQGLRYTRQYQGGLEELASSLRTVNTLIPDLQMYPNIQHIERGSGLVAESAFILAASVLELPIGISNMEEDHSQGDFYIDDGNRRIYWT